MHTKQKRKRNGYEHTCMACQLYAIGTFVKKTTCFFFLLLEKLDKSVAARTTHLSVTCCPLNSVCYKK